MDTDDLSNQAYNAVIITAEKFNHNLTLQFGLLSYECKNETEYLQQANQLIKEWNEDIGLSIEEIFFDVEHPSKEQFKKVLNEIDENISKVLVIPLEKRKFKF